MITFIYWLAVYFSKMQINLQSRSTPVPPLTKDSAGSGQKKPGESENYLFQPRLHAP